MTTRAKELFEASVDHVRRGRLRPALSALLDALASDPAHVESLEAAGKICRMLGATEDAELFETVAERPDDAEALYDLGYHLVEQARPDVAVSLLVRGLALIEDGTRRDAFQRELAYAQFLDRDFKSCLRTLSALEESPELAEAETLDVRLLQAESSLYLGRRELCERYLDMAEESVADDAQRDRIDALHGLLGRSAHWPRLDAARIREWHFIQHAGVILKTAGGWFEDGSRAGRFDILELRLDMVAFLLQRLAHLLERLGVQHELVASVSPTAAPLAHALGSLLDLPVAELGDTRGGRDTLMVAASAGELEPLCNGLSRHRSDLRLFALNLDWSRDNLVMPDVCGVLAKRVFLPWETRYSMDPSTGETRELPPDGRPPVEIAGEILAAVSALPDDGGRAREEFEAFYVPLADELVLGNDHRHPNRRVFAHLSPCWSPVGPRASLNNGDKETDAPH